MIEIRATRPDELRAATAVTANALLQSPRNDEDWEKARPSAEAADSLSAWDGDRCVAQVAAYRFDTLVPGGAWLPTNAVTRIGVLPSHRRRGLLRSMIEQLLSEGRERGQILASLRASEATIYGRFGFGVAGSAASVTVEPARARPFSGTATGGSMRVLTGDEILATLPPIYARAASRVGVLTRPEWMWERYFRTAVELGGDAEFVAVHTSADGVDDGFVHYKVEWDEGRARPPRGKGEVYDLIGADPAVELALWEYVCNVDLVTDWYCDERPVDDVARLAVNDPRGYRTMWHWDEQWLRLLDVDAALSRRAFASVEGAFTVAVTDPMFADNDGVWEISAAGAKRTGEDASGADLVAGIADLSAAYLGGVHWSALAAAGKVDVRNDAALTVADRLFVTVPAPFSGTGF